MAAIGVLLVVDFLFLMVSSNPELSDKVTKNAHWLCDMTGFNGRLDSLLALQIVKKEGDGQGGDVVLATLDTSGARLSDRLRSPGNQRHYVSGRLDPLERSNAFLKLTILELADDEDGVYSCQVHYTDHPADTEHSTWSQERTVSQHGESNATETPGFRVWSSTGVRVTCDYSYAANSQDYVSKMTISATERPWTASWRDKDEEATSSPDLLGPYHRRVGSGAHDRLEVHIPSATCRHQSEHVCTVTTSSGKTWTSPKVPLQLENCPQPQKAEPPAADKTTTASSTVASSTTVDRGASNVVYYVAAAVVVVVLVLASVGLICLRRRGRKGGDKSLNKHSFWERMNGGFTNPLKKDSKPETPEEIENANNRFLAEIRPDKRNDDPLLSAAEKEKDKSLKADETSGMEEALLPKLYEEPSSSTEVCTDPPKAVKSIDFCADVAAESFEDELCDVKCDINMKDNAPYDETSGMEEALLPKLNEERPSSTEVCTDPSKPVKSIDFGADVAAESVEEELCDVKCDVNMKNNAPCNRSDSVDSEKSSSSDCSSSSYVDLSVKMKIPVQASDCSIPIIHVV